MTDQGQRGTTPAQISGAGRISNTALAALAAPALPMAAMTLPLTIFLPAFYAQTVGIKLATVGLIFGVVRIADLFLDPLIGTLMDSTRSRWGRFKPWMAAGVPLVMIGAWLLFLARPGDGPVRLAIALVVGYVGYSIVILSQMGWGAALTASYEERSRVFAWWQALNMSGVILVLALPSILRLFMPVDNEVTVHSMGYAILITLPIGVAVALGCVRQDRGEATPHRHSIGSYIGLLRVRSARLLLITVGLFGFAMGIASSVYVLFFVTLRHIPVPIFSLVLVGWMGMSFAASPAWVMIGNRIGKHRGLAIACAVTALYYLSLIVMPVGSVAFLIAVSVFGGFCACALDVLPRSMMADVSDEDLLVSGQDRTGLLYALLNVTVKIGQAFSIGAVFVLLGLLGFDARAGAANPPSGLLGVLLFATVIPAALDLLAAGTIWRYPLTALRHRHIRGRLDAARNTTPAPLGLAAPTGLAE